MRREDKIRIRSAVYTMAALITSHLVCNCFHVLLVGTYVCENSHKTPLTVLEELKSPLLYIKNECSNEFLEWTLLYTILSDVTNFLFTFSSCLRLPIYYMCNVEDKREVRLIFIRLAHPLTKIVLDNHTEPTVFPLADVLSENSAQVQPSEQQSESVSIIANGHGGEDTRVRFIDDYASRTEGNENGSNESIEYRL